MSIIVETINEITIPNTVLSIVISKRKLSGHCLVCGGEINASLGSPYPKYSQYTKHEWLPSESCCAAPVLCHDYYHESWRMLTMPSVAGDGEGDGDPLTIITNIVAVHSTGIASGRGVREITPI